MAEIPPAEKMLNYESTGSYGNAPLLVKLAGIFSIVAASLTLLAAIGQGAEAITFSRRLLPIMATAATAPAGTMTSYSTSGSSTTFYYSSSATTLPVGFTTFFSWIPLFYGGACVLNLAFGTVELAGGILMLRRSRRGVGWGIASTVTGFLSMGTLLFSVCCVLAVFPLASSVFTLVVLSMENCRRYLRAHVTA